MLSDVLAKKTRRVIGLMSGTSADGVDAALTTITGSGTDMHLILDAFVSIPFERSVHDRILEIASGVFGGAREICLMNALLGKLYLNACEAVCEEGGIDPKEVDLVGCHGQTVFHQPEPTAYLGEQIASTLQIGDPSILCEKLNAVVVSDFRVRDMAAGGQGAPLVPYAEYLMYRNSEKNIALQNIGGIGNITLLRKNCDLDEIIAFDTGPGNMLIDAAVMRLTDGKETYDKDGMHAAEYGCSEKLLQDLMQDGYLHKKPPKTSGREYYGKEFLDRVYEKAEKLSLSKGEVLRTLTRYTAETIAYSVREYLPVIPDRLVISGGGSMNPVLMADLRAALPEVEVLRNEDIGLSSDAKEAVAFAILANEAIEGNAGNVPSATGAAHRVVLGKIEQ